MEMQDRPSGAASTSMLAERLTATFGPDRISLVATSGRNCLSSPRETGSEQKER
jgi:hypothetical protein